VCCGLLVIVLVQPIVLAGPPSQVPIAQLLEELPQGDRWIRHLKEDLLPFWAMKTALGTPVGNYPTYRCNDGSLYNPQSPCPELTYAADGIVWLDRDYVRAKSRQIFAYGIAYHLTGEPKYLIYAKAGVDFLRTHALDPQGGAFTYWLQPANQPGLQRLERTSQDLAYALTGMAFTTTLLRSDGWLVGACAVGRQQPLEKR
jgi:mannose/cellobiose epimerase-like protein (N-acyl-D-glucosamine 2-epimerase family)